jgi:hypothetical protein
MTAQGFWQGFEAIGAVIDDSLSFLTNLVEYLSESG